MSTYEWVDAEVVVEYDVGSPPSDEVEAEIIQESSPWRHRATFEIGEGETAVDPDTGGGAVSGVTLSAYESIHLPYTTDDRRQVFCLLQRSQVAVDWKTFTVQCGQLWLTTDHGPTEPPRIDVDGLGSGSYFAWEGEKETEYLTRRQGKKETITL
jgi:hypothetical protein